MAKKRANGEGSVFKNKDGYWVAKVANGKNDDGAMQYKVFKSKKQKEVLEKLKVFNQTNTKGLSLTNNTYLEDYILNWINTVKVNDLKSTAFDRAMSTINTHIIPKLGHYKIMDLTTEIIQTELINKMVTEKSKYTGKPLSRSSIDKAYVYLHSCLDYAVKNRKLPYNPCINVSKPSKEKFVKKTIRFFNDEEIKQFIIAARIIDNKTNLPKEKYGEAYILNLYTGLRIGELTGLRYKNVDLKGKKILVTENIVKVYDRTDPDNLKRIMKNQNTTKTGLERWVPLCNTAYDIIKILYDKCSNKENYLIANSNELLDTGSLIRGYVRICKKAGITHCGGVHTLRHTFASLLFRKGVDIKTVSSILGHTDVAFTSRTYIHLIDEQRIQAVSQLDEL